MKKLLILLILLTLFLSGCGVYNLSNFVLPNDLEFISCIEKLDNPQKICNYMKENFTRKDNIFYNPNPYELWLCQEGDCNDLATFAIFVANYHNYTTYQIQISFKGTFIKHVLAVYLEDDGYTYSNFKAYRPIYASSFKEIVSDYFSISLEYKLKSYKVYDYDMNLIGRFTSL